MLRYWLVPVFLGVAGVLPAAADDDDDKKTSRDRGVQRADSETGGVRVVSDQELPDRNFGVRAVDGSDPLSDWEEAEIPPGMVLFRFEGADLDTEVLPRLREQAGVELEWDGGPREVTLRLTEPVEWEDAVDLLCRFNDLHLAETYDGELELREEWGGELDGDYEDIESQLPNELTLPAGAPRERGSVDSRRRADRALARLRSRTQRAMSEVTGRDEVQQYAKDYAFQSFSGHFQVSRVQGRTSRGRYARARPQRGRYPRARQQRGRYPRARQQRGRYARARQQRGRYARARQQRGRYARARQQRGRYPRVQRQRGRYPRGRVARGR